ncbi:hypothetical protein AB0L25_24110 [Spirillospora sp. NPDC052242]
MPGDARRLLDRLGPIPAYLVDERQDIVAWNRAAVELITDFGALPAEERNTVRLSIRLGGALCSPPEGEGNAFARQFAAQLRAASVRRPADRVLVYTAEPGSPSAAALARLGGAGG